MNGRRAAAVVLAAASPLAAAFEDRSFSARSSALGGAAVALEGGASSGYDNPALLSTVNAASLTAGRIDVFGWEDLAQDAVAAQLPAGGGAAALHYLEFGGSLYRERELGVSWGRGRAERGAWGVALKAQGVEMERYGRFWSAQVDAGWFGRPAPGWAAGAVVRNATQSRFRGVPERPLAVLHAGLATTRWNNASTALAFRRDADGGSQWRFGQELRPSPALALRAGYQSSPALWSLGWGIARSGFSVDYAYLAHPVLPPRHQFTFSWTAERRGGASRAP